MRRTTLLLAIFAASLASIYAQSAVTNPVGFETTTINAGKIGGVSLPLDSIPAFSGAISSRTSSTITTTGAAFGTLSSASAPYLIRLVDGTSSGRQFKITSNTTDTLTLQTNGTDLTTATANGDHYDVVAIQTLSTFFGPTADPNKPPINRNADATVADNVLLRGAFGYLTYYNDGANWLLVSGGATPQNDVALLPDQGFLFQRRAGPAIALTVTGAVPRSNLKTDLPANKITIFPNRFPVGTTLTGLNLQSIGTWKKDDDATLADNLLIRGSFGWLTYYVNAAGQWRLTSGGTTDQGPTPIPIGSAVLVVRRPGSLVTLDQPLPYSLQ